MSMLASCQRPTSNKPHDVKIQIGKLLLIHRGSTTTTTATARKLADGKPFCYFYFYFYVLMSWGPTGGQQTEYNT